MSRTEPSHEEEVVEISFPIYTLAYVMLAVCAAGVVFQIVVLAFTAFSGGDLPDWLQAYRHGPAMKVAVALAVASIFGSYFHRRYTGMGINGLTRILANVWVILWIISFALLMKQAMNT
jgi:hypothetical protein